MRERGRTENASTRGTEGTIHLPKRRTRRDEVVHENHGCAGQRASRDQAAAHVVVSLTRAETRLVDARAYRA